MSTPWKIERLTTMRQRIKAYVKNELCLQIGRKYRVYATGAGCFYDNKKYYDYTLEYSKNIDGAMLRRNEGFISHNFNCGFDMVNFGTWITYGSQYDYEIEGPL